MHPTIVAPELSSLLNGADHVDVKSTEADVTLREFVSGVLGWQPGWMRMLFLKVTGTLHRLLYRWSGGRMGRTFRGGPVLLLTTTGRKTGRQRTWPLCYLITGDDLVLVASAGGVPRHPAWYLNLRANPRVSIQLGDRTRTMVARTAEGTERARLWERAVRQYSGCAGYQRRSGREIPVVILRPVTPAEGTAKRRVARLAEWVA